MTWQLAPGELRRIDSVEQFSRLTVVGGCVWVTTTPADDDIVLRTGDTWQADHGWPVLVQAVAPTTINLVREDVRAPAAEHRGFAASMLDAVVGRARGWRRARLTAGARR